MATFIASCCYCKVHYVSDKPLTVGWKKLRKLKDDSGEGWCCPECSKGPQCAYESTDCCGPVAIVVHDKRGCLNVCAHHAVWRTTTSRMGGHAKSCSESIFADVRPPFSMPMFTILKR